MRMYHTMCMVLLSGMLMAAVPVESSVEEVDTSVASKGPDCQGLEQWVGPQSPGLLQVSHGAQVPVCLQNSVEALAGGYVLADLDNFFGNLRADVDISGRWRLSERFGVFVEIEALRYQTVISSVSATSLGLGPLGLGAQYRLKSVANIDMSVFVRAELPTTTGLYVNARPLALNIGAVGSTKILSWLRVHGGVHTILSIMLSRGPALPRNGLGMSIGAQALPQPWLSLKLDVQTLFLYRAALDYLTLAFESRVLVGDKAYVGLVLYAPMAGFERALMRATLGGGYRF